MTELIEVNEIVTDDRVWELRPGDRVKAVENDSYQGTVFSVTPPEGEIIGDPSMGQVSVETSPTITVLWDSGVYQTFVPQFLRATAWRWQCLELRRT